jgi:hypothetical protein
VALLLNEKVKFIEAKEKGKLSVWEIIMVLSVAKPQLK